jgi:hypothetical protein
MQKKFISLIVLTSPSAGPVRAQVAPVTTPALESYDTPGYFPKGGLS